MPNIDLSILNQRQTPAFFADTLANRPAAGFIGRIFVSTDTYAFYRDNGTGWDLIGGPGTGTITGTGASGQIALWNGASTITGDTGLTYDGTANSLTADKFIVSGGTSSQFLKANGTLDSNTYNTGSGAVNQVAFWNGTNSITGENNLWWDSVNNHFGINTNAPGTALDIHHDQSTMLQLNQTTATNDSRIAFQNSGTALWRIGNFYNAGANDWGIFDVVGAAQPFTIKKTTGQTFIGAETTTSGRLVVNNATGDNHIVVIGATAPSIRINNAGSGATKQIGIGLATAVNNFIQGAVDRDMCIYNSSTTSSPIIFGIYGTTNTQEAARISASRNFLLGTSIDAGQRLQVSGDLAVNTGTGATFRATIDSTNRVEIGNFSAGSGYRETTLASSVIRLSTGTAGSGSATTRLTIGETGAATFSGSVSVNGLSTSANYQLGASGRAYFSGLNDKGIFISDSNSPAYVSLVGLNSAISSYNNVELRASGTDGQLYLTTASNVLVGGLIDGGQRFQVNGTARITGITQIGSASSSNGLSNNTILRTSSGSVNSGASIGNCFAAAGSGSGFDTEISVNMGTCGATMLLMASINTSTGTGTNSAVYIVRFYFDGNNLPTTTYLGGSSDFVTFSVSGNNTLILTASNSGNRSYSWFINKIEN